jgi:hypothetical protein
MSETTRPHNEIDDYIAAFSDEERQEYVVAETALDLASILPSANHSLTDSVSEAVLKNLAGRIYLLLSRGDLAERVCQQVPYDDRKQRLHQYPVGTGSSQ